MVILLQYYSRGVTIQWSLYYNTMVVVLPYNHDSITMQWPFPGGKKRHFYGWSAPLLPFYGAFLWINSIFFIA
jgi:hypothetical protein